MASDPNGDHTSIIASFNDIAGIVDKMSATTCNAPSVLDTSTEVTQTIEDCEVKYFRPACGALTNTSIEVLTMSGQVGPPTGQQHCYSEQQTIERLPQRLRGFSALTSECPPANSVGRFPCT